MRYLPNYSTMVSTTYSQYKRSLMYLNEDGLENLIKDAREFLANPGTTLISNHHSAIRTSHALKGAKTR